MNSFKKVLSVLVTFAMLASYAVGFATTVNAIAYNEVDGPREAGELTAYIYGDFVTEGDLGQPFGHTNPWSAFDWLTDGETMTLAYSGPRIETSITAGTQFDLSDMGEYGYLGTAKMPAGSGMADLLGVLVSPARNDVRIYYYNLTDDDVNVSFHIQSTSAQGFGAHSIAAVVTPDGTTALDKEDAEDPDQNLSADFSFTLSPYEGTEPTQSLGDDGSGSDNRPVDPEDGKAPAGCFYISLTTQPNLGGDPSAGVVVTNFFAGGDNDKPTSVNLKAPEHGSYTATAELPDGEGTKTVTETVVAGGEDKSFSYVPANGFTLSAEGDDDYGFDYWSKDGLVLSYDETITTRSYTAGSEVVANFLPKSQTRAFEVAGSRYVSWVDAVNAAKSANEPVILKKDYTFAATGEELTAKGDVLQSGVIERNDGAINYIVPAGVKFLVPFNAQDTGSFADGPAFSVEKPGNAYKTLTVPSNVTLTVKGKLNVNACAYANNSTSFMGGAAGNYGFIALSGTLNVDDGGEIRTYGYIAGPGRVNVNSGATSYEVLQMADWGGGSNAMSWNGSVSTDDNSLEKAFFFSQYYVQNVESDYRVYSGAMAYVYGHLTAGMGSIKVFANVPAGFIGNGDTLFTMSNGYIERRYDGATDRITYDVHGDMVAKAITVDVLSIATVASQKWLLGLTNNMDIVASEGTTTLQYGYMVLPDTRIRVEEGASVVIADTAKVHIWRLDDWKNGYVGGPSNSDKKIVPIRYTVANGENVIRTEPTRSGLLEVYGTVEAYSNIFTTNNGGTADDMVIRGTGTLINHPGDATSGLHILKSSSSFEQIQTLPVLSYMYGETELGSFETGTYYSKAPEVDKHGNGTYDSWYQWQVDYTLTDQNGNTVEYTDYAFNSTTDLDGALISDETRYIITGIDSITDANGNPLSSVQYNGNATKDGIAINKNVDISDGWEVVEFTGLDRDIKINAHVKSYDHIVTWNETLANGTVKKTASYVTGNAAEYKWAQPYAVSATVDPSESADISIDVSANETVLRATDIVGDITVNIAASTDRHPVVVNVEYPDGTSETVNIDSQQFGDEWKAVYAVPALAEGEGHNIISEVALTNGDGVAYENEKDGLILTGIVTDNVIVDVTLVHKDYKVEYDANLVNGDNTVSIIPDYVDAGETVTLSNSRIKGFEGISYVFGNAEIVTDGSAASINSAPTSVTISGIDSDIVVSVPVEYYDFTVIADGITKYAVNGGEVEFVLEAGYALNGAEIGNGQSAELAYTNPETPSGSAVVTVSNVRSNVTVTLDKVHFDAVVNFKDASDNLLDTKYYENGSTVSYKSVDNGIGNERYYVENAESSSADVTFTSSEVSVTNVSELSADVIVDLVPFDYKVTWVNSESGEEKYDFITGEGQSATYTAQDDGVGGVRYIIQSGYGEHASGATNTYTYDKSQYTVSNINADEKMTITLKQFVYKITFVDQNDGVLKTQYSDENSQDVTINVGDNTIRYNVAGQDMISNKNTVIAGCELTGTATVNGGEEIGEGVQLVTLSGIASDVVAKLEVYEYDHKVIVVVNDINGWDSESAVKYVEGDTFTWVRPDGKTYVVDSASSTYGVAAKSSDTEVSLDLAGISEVEVELSILKRDTEVRLAATDDYFINRTGTITPATIEVTDAAYGEFTIECAKACMIILQYKENPEDTDFTYVKIPYLESVNENKYRFSLTKEQVETLQAQDDAKVIVAIKGDVSQDGRVNSADANLIGRSCVTTDHRAYRKLSNFEFIMADLWVDDKINSADANVIGRSCVTIDHRAYSPIKW